MLLLHYVTGYSSIVGSDAYNAVHSSPKPLFESKPGGRLVVVLNTRFDTQGSGFEASFSTFSRLSAMMTSDSQYTNAQYSMAFLESQGANVTALTKTRNAEDLFRNSNACMGPVTVAERCFISCSARLVPYFPQLQRTHTDPERFPLWSNRPLKGEVGNDEFVSTRFTTEVQLNEIPAPVRSMGYRPSHFVRTAYVSQFPPGSFKAPVAVPIGPISEWDARGDADPSAQKQPTRPRIGWGLRVFYNLSNLPQNTMKWDRGWAAPENDRLGQPWPDPRGASDEVAPDWHILGPAGEDLDTQRFSFDLFDPDLPLYTFVDTQRRVVIANSSHAMWNSF